MADYLQIQGGSVYDPKNGVDGDSRDIWILDGRIVVPPEVHAVNAARVIDATGLVVMPGGIDMHCHIAGPKVNAARKLRPEDKHAGEQWERSELLRSGTTGSVPSTFTTGYLYAGLGYTTAFDAAVPPLASRHAHDELADTPCLDKGFFALLGNNHFVMRSIQQGNFEHLRAFIGWLLSAVKGYAPKLVNPGGVEVWKQQSAGNVAGFDETVPGFEVTPRQIVTQVTRAANELGLPHPVHIHGNNLGMPGNWSTTLETMKSLGGHRGHITHIQFHSYGGGDGEEQTFCSQTVPLAEYVNDHANLTVDVGQVLFGKTTSMTGDGPLGYYLHKLGRDKWYSCDVEMEAGCGITPIEYRNQSLVNALQWAIGLEWFLLVDDPWQVAMSTDHPNGGSFLAYPQIIHLLMDRTYRAEVLKTCPDKVHERCLLADLDRQYTLYEIAIITRAGPARILGLENKGHLGAGADADITIYSPDEDLQRMFELPRIVIKAGEVVVENGEIRAVPSGKTLHVTPEFDEAVVPSIREWFDDHYTIQFDNYVVDSEYLPDAESVGCRQ